MEKGILLSVAAIAIIISSSIYALTNYTVVTYNTTMHIIPLSLLKDSEELCVYQKQHLNGQVIHTWFRQGGEFRDSCYINVDNKTCLSCMTTQQFMNSP